jgi:hypothetical protein
MPKRAVPVIFNAPCGIIKVAHNIWLMRGRQGMRMAQWRVGMAVSGNNVEQQAGMWWRGMSDCVQSPVYHSCTNIIV